MPVQEINIPAGTSLLIGAPSQPMDDAISSEIAKIIDSIDGIVEAHLPQVFAIGVMTEPAQVLVIVLGQNAEVDDISAQLGLDLVLPEGMHLDVWPIPIGHEMLHDIRSTGCMI